MLNNGTSFKKLEQNLKTTPTKRVDTHGENGYHIWKISTLPSNWALISLPMAAEVLRFLKFHKYLGNYMVSSCHANTKSRETGKL